MSDWDDFAVSVSGIIDYTQAPTVNLRAGRRRAMVKDDTGPVDAIDAPAAGGGGGEGE